MRTTRQYTGIALIGVSALALVGLTGCGPDPADAPTSTPLADYAIHLSATPVHLGTNAFVIQNGGSEEHEFIGFKIDQPVTQLALAPDGDLNEDVLKNVTDGDN